MKKGIIVGTLVLSVAFLFAACHHEEEECVDIAGTYAVTKTFEDMVCVTAGSTVLTITNESTLLPLTSTLVVNQIECSIAGSETTTTPPLTIAYLGDTDEHDRFSMSIQSPVPLALDMSIDGLPTVACNFNAGIEWNGSAPNDNSLVGVIDFALTKVSGDATCPASCTANYNFAAIK